MSWAVRRVASKAALTADQRAALRAVRWAVATAEKMVALSGENWAAMRVGLLG